MPGYPISSKNKRFSTYLSDIWINREIIIAFAKKNILGKIAQTKLGVFLLLIQVIILTITLGFIVGRVSNINVGYPYLIYLTTGMCGWYIFSYLSSFSGMSLIQNQHIISKVYFPRILIPFSYGLSVFADFIAWFIVLIVIMLGFGIYPTFNILFFPLFLFLNIILGLAIGIWVSVLSIYNRDIVLITPLILGFGVFLTPIFYPIEIMPEWFKLAQYFNPLAGVIEGYRCSIVNTTFNMNYLYGFALTFILFITATYFFAKKDGSIADTL